MFLVVAAGSLASVWFACLCLACSPMSPLLASVWLACLCLACSPLSGLLASVWLFSHLSLCAEASDVATDVLCRDRSHSLCENVDLGCRKVLPRFELWFPDSESGVPTVNYTTEQVMGAIRCFRDKCACQIHWFARVTSFDLVLVPHRFHLVAAPWPSRAEPEEAWLSRA